MSPQKDTQEEPQADSRAEKQAELQSAPMEPNASVPSADVVWVRISPNQVMRAVVVALLSAAVVLGAFFLLWQVRTFVGWFVIALFLAAVSTLWSTGCSDATD
jgi:multidrug efflux pump subunit AcrB